MNQMQFLMVVIFTTATFTLVAFITAQKCPGGSLVNPVFEKGSCKVRTRNVYVADLISPEFKGKFSDSPAPTVQWVDTITENDTIIPGHFIILNASGRTGK